MTVTILSPVRPRRQLGLWNLSYRSWLVIGGLSGQIITEDIEMFAQKALFSSFGRSAVLAAVAAVALSAAAPSLAQAGSAPAGVTAQKGTSGATDFSSRGRRYGGGGAAAAAAFAGIVGTGIAIAASQPRYYDDSYAYYGGPGYYEGPAYGGYYGGNPYYGGGHYGFQYGRGYRNTFPTP